MKFGSLNSLFRASVIEFRTSFPLHYIHYFDCSALLTIYRIDVYPNPLSYLLN